MAKQSTRRDRVVQEVRYELDQLSRVAEMADLLAVLPPDERCPWDAAAAAKYVADLIGGRENICKHRYHFLGKELPVGPDSHSRILQDFVKAPELGAALCGEHVDRLKKYLSFRHRFVHGYGYEVSWEVIEEPIRLLPDTVKILTEIWEQWLDSLGRDPSSTYKK